MKLLAKSAESGLALKKLELEIKQLEVELRRYDERLALSDQKLRSDVRDWYWRIVIALASTIVGVVTFLWTQSYQRYTDDFKSVSTRIEEDDKGFSDILQRLSDASPSIRLSAADGLLPFAEMTPIAPRPPTLFQRFWADLAGKTDSTELFNLVEAATRRRKIDAIQIAADRLVFEDDVRVMESLGGVLSAGGATSIPYVAAVNRSLANGLARNFGSLLAAKAIGDPNRNYCDAWSSESDPLTGIDNLIARVQMPYQGTGTELRFEPSKMFLHSFSVREFVTIQCHLDSRPSGQPILASNESALRSGTVRGARALALTSYILIKFLQAGQSRANASEKIDLEGVQLVTGTGFDKINWTEVTLDNGYISGTPAYFSCHACSFRFAALQDLNLGNGSDLIGSDMTGVHMRQ
jgi:nitrogen fixation-related uncharacterized protein